MCTYPFPLKPLPYSYDALEPHIDSETLYLHHQKHLKSYVDQLNETLENYPSLHSFTLEQLLCNLAKLPKEIQENILNYGGGVYNHNLYFSTMGYTPANCDLGLLDEAIQKEFYSFDFFRSYFIETATQVFGSGYAWLVMNPQKQLIIIKTPNQNTPLPYELYPLLLVDVWEHSYYLKYQNKRKTYVENWFQTVNWKVVQENFISASST